MILATDLDRTLLPNGQDEYDNSLPVLFSKLEDIKNLNLIYVSGQNLDLLNKSIKKYNLDRPDYFIGEVGTVLYKKQNSHMQPHEKWRRNIEKNNPLWDRETIVKKINMQDKLILQEGWKQNEFKISYYLKAQNQSRKVINEINKKLKDLNINARIVWSVDPLQNTGLIDVLPQSATKLTALEFVRKELGESMKDVIYCGDSGNDILPLTFGYNSILVKNAPEEVKKEVLKIAKSKKIKDKIYIARGTGKLNGNYSSGIIEGLIYMKIFS